MAESLQALMDGCMRDGFLLDTYRYYKDLPHQREAISWLQGQIPDTILSDFQKRYSPPEPPKRPASCAIRLSVPYYTQADSQLTINGFPQDVRMCFSSVCAMAVEFLLPATLGPNGDDKYLKKLISLGGDTTSPDAQIETLAAFGIEGSFTRRFGGFAALDDELIEGFPVGMGILHHGPVSKPTGGGHWILCIGKTADGKHIYNDPAGEMDVVNGGYPTWGKGGQAIAYTDRNLGRRWLEGGECWAMTFRPA